MLPGCLTTEQDVPFVEARTLYRFKCSDGDDIYMSISDDGSGILKYKGVALKINGHNAQSGVKYVTSDERIIVYFDKYENITLHVLRETSVFCKKQGTYDPV